MGSMPDLNYLMKMKTISDSLLQTSLYCQHGRRSNEQQNSSSSATSSGSSNQATAKILAFSPSPTKKNIKSKSRAMDRNKCNICRGLFNLHMDKELKSLWIGCDARGCQLLEKLIKSVLSSFRWMLKTYSVFLWDFKYFDFRGKALQLNISLSI